MIERVTTLSNSMTNENVDSSKSCGHGLKSPGQTGTNSIDSPSWQADQNSQGSSVHRTKGNRKNNDRDEASVTIVAVDGPAGSGKSSICTAVCQRLGWSHVNTGAIYRAVGLLGIKRRPRSAE